MQSGQGQEWRGQEVGKSSCAYAASPLPSCASFQRRAHQRKSGSGSGPCHHLCYQFPTGPRLLTSGSVATPSPWRTSCSPSRGGVMRGVGVGTSSRSVGSGGSSSAGSSEDHETAGWQSWGSCSCGGSSREEAERGQANTARIGLHCPHLRSTPCWHCREPPGSGPRPAAPGTATG